MLFVSWCCASVIGNVCPNISIHIDVKERYTVAKLSIATGHDMQIYNCLGQLRQL